MEKASKDSFVEIPLNNFNKKSFQFPSTLFETRFAPNPKNLTEFRKILEAHGYHVINLISTDRIIFATKSVATSWIGAVELKEHPQSQKNLYLSLNISASLPKTIQPYFLMKNWKIENKVYLNDEKGNGVALIEYHLAQSDLRSFIESQRQLKSKIQLDRLCPIFKMLLESVHYSHIDNIHLNDIRPETIFYENNRWFIMKGDLSEKMHFEYGANLSKHITLRPPNKLYSSPLVYESTLRNDQVFDHNPFKSDVYSLGLVLLELETIGIWSQQQFKEVLESRKTILTESSNFSLDFREKLVIKGRQIFMIPGILELMLQEKESDRGYIFELSLLMNSITTIMNKVVVPHEQFFKVEIIHTTTGRKKIVYPHVPIEYEGAFDEDTKVKDGAGIVYYNGAKTFEGNWKNNQPSDKCSIFFSQYWKYEGFIKESQFHGQGFLFFNGTRLNERPWYYNLSEDRVDITDKATKLPVGYYFFVKSGSADPHEDKEYKVYYKKFHCSQKALILNTYLIDPKLILFVINKILAPFTITRVKVIEDQNKVLYNCGQHQMIKLFTKEKQVIEILTGINHARALLFKLLESEVVGKQGLGLELDLSNTKFCDDELREIFDKQVRVEILDISKCKIADKGLRILSINEGARHLRSLNMSYLDISDKALLEFIFSKAVEGLEELFLNFCKNLSSQAIASFFCNQKMKRIKRIEIEATSFTHNGLQHLIKFHNFNHLQYLNVGLCHKINDTFFNSFTKSPISSQMLGLSLNSTVLSDSILEVMGSEDSKMNNLQRINLSGSINLTFYGLSRLFLSPKACNITAINLSGTYIDDEFLRLLAKKSTLRHPIREFHVSSCFAITDKGITTLLKSQHFSQLDTLDLSKTFISNQLLFQMSKLSSWSCRSLNFNKCCKVSDAGLEKLITSDSFRGVEVLNLGFLGVQALTFMALAETKYSVSLRQLILEECTKIEDPSLIQYLNSFNFKSLETLNLSKTLISKEVLRHFQTNSHNHYKFIEIDITGCKNVGSQGLQHVCLPNKLISTIKRKEGRNNSIKELAKSTLLLKMNKLDLSSTPETDFPSLFQSQYCMNLSTICITDSSLKGCFQHMGSSKYLKNIKVLELKSCSIDENSFKAYLKSENVALLEELDIGWTLLGNPTMYAIAESQHLSYLEVLKVTKCININDKGMHRYLNSKVCQSLKTLDLRATLLTNNTLESISKSTNIKELNRLCIRSCPNIKNLGLSHLLASRNCHNFKYLDLSWNAFTGDIFKYLKQTKELSELKELEVAGLKNIDRDLLNYLNSNNVNSLKKLDISSVQLSDETLQVIGNSEALESLDELNLSNCKVTKKALLQLLASKNLQKVQKINLSECVLGAEVVKFLLQESPRFQKMQTIVVSSTRGLPLDDVHKHFRNLSIVTESSK